LICKLEEDWLAQLEGEAVLVLERLLNDPDSISSLSVKEELHMAKFITALRFRPQLSELTMRK
jgi:hypothetical protein